MSRPKLKLRPTTTLEEIAPGVLRWTDRDGFVVIVYVYDSVKVPKDDNRYTSN